MKVNGACACGAIRIEAEVDPEKTNICHCTDCQTATGTAFRVSVQVPGAMLKVTGKPSTCVKTTADSGNPRVQAFCGNCGSPLYSTTVGDGVQPFYMLRVGIFRQREQFVPKRQIWWRSAQPWITKIGDVFRSRLKPSVREEYVTLANRMNELARTMPGYISHKDFYANDGERVAIVEFAHEEGQRAWQTKPEHSAAQKLAREKYYTEYHIQVCTLDRESKFKLPEQATVQT
jgi:hypothetical protein